MAQDSLALISPLAEEVLMELLWPGTDRKAARNTLDVASYQIGRAGQAKFMKDPGDRYNPSPKSPLGDKVNPE